jgi:quinohemoprotein ethanol dehydrogenase
VQQLLLADLNIKGQQRKVLMQANKDGFYYVVDRVSGQFISGQPYAKVTWAKGLDERTGRPFVNPQAHYGTDPIAISPGPGGAHNWAPMSFNPATGLVYVPTTLVSSSNFAVDTEFVVKPRQSNIGVKRNTAQANANGVSPPPPAKLPEPPAIGPEPPADNQARSALVAWDPVTQKARWQTPGGGSIGGGTVTTAGNLVIQVIPDGRLVAYSADKGEKLLDVQTGLRGGMGPPITYMLDGKQYIALMGGTGVVIARSAEPGAAPPPPTAQTVTPKLMTFVLDGKPVQ